jgi:hypothetical protein
MIHDEPDSAEPDLHLQRLQQSYTPWKDLPPRSDTGKTTGRGNPFAVTLAANENKQQTRTS